jgi:uncharacterized integral membrane protein
MSATGQTPDRTSTTGTSAPGGVRPAGGTGPVPPTPGRGPVVPGTVPRTRAGGLWVAVGVFAVLLLFLLVFVLQNLQSTTVHLLGAHWRVPVGAALLLAAVAGVLLAAAAAMARILQLRALARRRGGAPPVSDRSGRRR